MFDWVAEWKAREEGNKAVVRAVLFDLDGTLLDTLGDLTDAVNAALVSMGFETRTQEEVRTFIGNGAQKLILRALPAGQEDAAAECLRRFKAHYGAHMDVRTMPYPGVIEMLDALCVRGIACAVLSNKYDGAVRPLCEKYFGKRITIGLGEREGIARKPAPDGCDDLLRRLSVSAEEAIYVGDSEADVLTAKAAGMRCIAVTWGFRTREALACAGAEAMADSADELLEIILKGELGDDSV